MITKANARDASFVLAQLNPHDRAETVAQNPDFDPRAWGVMCVQDPNAFIAYAADGTPVTVFGAQPFSSTTVLAWLLSTRRVSEVVRPVTRFIDGPLRADLRRQGFVWAEARALDTQEAQPIHRWLHHFGASIVATLPEYGAGGENFALFRARL